MEVLRQLLSMDLVQAGKIINSRMGMLLIFMFYVSSPWGAGAKIDNLIRVADRMLTSIEETRQVAGQNKDHLIRLVERCELSQKPRKRKKAAEDEEADGYTAMSKER